MTPYDQEATTAKLRALSHADALELKRQAEADRRAAQIYARQELMQYLSMGSLGVLSAFGLWKLADLVLLAVRSTP